MYGRTVVRYVDRLTHRKKIAMTLWPASEELGGGWLVINIAIDCHIHVDANWILLFFDKMP